MKFTHLLLICLMSFMFFTFVQCDSDEDMEEPRDEEETPKPVPHGKHPVLRKVFLSAPSWMHIPFSIVGAALTYIAYHFYG
ncbi:unnamed protein product [Schistosoma margrebowiei]|uniref:Uncharacterized protein n=1 Tax=Schistosoma margrebowiei TaxID=48269 RepID=A0AA84ZFN4_9TREM|nr:unnamed protein product [Schistosoma margrebowiei]